MSSLSGHQERWVKSPIRKEPMLLTAHSFPAFMKTFFTAKPLAPPSPAVFQGRGSYARFQVDGFDRKGIGYFDV